MANAIDIQTLLAHSTWMRNLAKRLVRDEASADDLVQESLEIALKQREIQSTTVRPWLAQILRNLARAKFRSNSRRSQREHLASDQEAQVPSAEELVSCLEMQRGLADEVLALKEPYRSIILLSFYEGLSSADIAAQQQIPAGTVRWRLKTALEQLRNRLDQKQPGGRHAWVQAIIPLLKSKGRAGNTIERFIQSNTKGATMIKIGTTFIAAGTVAATLLVAKPWTNAQPQSSTKAVTTLAASSPAVQPTLPNPKIMQSHDEFLKKIQTARAIQPATRIKAATESEDKANGFSTDSSVLDKDYVQAQIRELMPLVKECYDHALQRDPNVKGKLSIKFSIVGDATVGGIVGESTIVDDDGTITDPEFRLCVQETMYAARFPAPQEGGEVQVKYPLVFSFESPDKSETTR